MQVENNALEASSDDDGKLWVKFEKRAVKLGAASEKAGHPVFKDEDYISIVVPGSADKYERKVTEEDKERFPRQWAKYQRNQEQTVDGWKITEWPAIGPAQAAELQHMGFMTVEMLAGASDIQCQKMMGMMGLRDKAKAALEVAKDQAAALRYAEENRTLRADIEDLTRQVREMAQQVEALQATGKRKAAS